MTEREIEAKLYALMGERAFVRLSHGPEPLYLGGTLREQGGTYTLGGERQEMVTFVLSDASHVELALAIIELKEGAGECHYWPPVIVDKS